MTVHTFQLLLICDSTFFFLPQIVLMSFCTIFSEHSKDLLDVSPMVTTTNVRFDLPKDSDLGKKLRKKISFMVNLRCHRTTECVKDLDQTLANEVRGLYWVSFEGVSIFKAASENCLSLMPNQQSKVKFVQIPHTKCCTFFSFGNKICSRIINNVFTWTTKKRLTIDIAAKITPLFKTT